MAPSPARHARRVHWYQNSTGQHRTARMTCSDLIVAAPWIVFGIALTVLCVWLLRSSRR